MKGLVNPSHTTNLCVKLHDPILKFIMTKPFTPMSCPFAVLIHVLLSEIWCNNPSADTVSYLMQLTCAPVSNSEENTESFTFILNVSTLHTPCLDEQNFFHYHCPHLCCSFQVHTPWLVIMTSTPEFFSVLILGKYFRCSYHLILGNAKSFYQVFFPYFTYLHLCLALLLQSSFPQLHC